MPEKLLTIQEVAKYLNLPEEEVKRLVDIGEIPAYKIGGTFLRFRKEQIDAMRQEIDSVESSSSDVIKPSVDAGGRPTHAYTDLEEEIKRREPIARAYDYTLVEKIRDFWHFNDFFVISGVIITLIVYIILQ
jgi:excisionase family DNA binding protein